MGNSNPWTKFFWNDWENDPGLRLCSLAAQGFWMRVLCICAKADPAGYVTVEGKALSHDDLSLLTGRPVSEILPLIDELSDRGVFSRDATGRMYSRRMVKDARKNNEARKNGKLGGNPNLLNSTTKPYEVKGNIILMDKPPDKPHSHSPLANTISQHLSPEVIQETARATGLADEIHREEVLPSAWHDYAQAKEIPDEQIYKSWTKFKQITVFPFSLNRWKKWIDRERVSRTA